MTAPVLITGGAGFIGSNIADALLAGGRAVHVYDALARPGVERNLDWLRRHGSGLSATIADVRDHDRLAHAAREASAVIHLAAQVAVTTSLEDPLTDFAINVEATLRLLEAVRAQPVPFLFASTNKVYGDLADLAFRLDDDAYRPADARLMVGIGEDRPLDFHTPYGCSKGAADQYVLDYARSFGVPATVFRMSCVYGQRQMGTEDQGWVAHFLIRALDGEPITIFGDGHQVRDVLDVGDVVAAYLGALGRTRAVAGRAFNLGGGPDNAVSLRRLLAHIERLLGRPVATAGEDWRAGDQRWFVADCSAVRAALGLAPFRPWRDGIAALATWLDGERAPTRVAA